jgi:GT2 family glycosyltransferase
MYKDTLKGDPFCLHKKAYKRYKEHGFKGMIDRLDVEYKKTNLQKVNTTQSYEQWIENSEEDILEISELKNTPLISIITPTYNTNKTYLVYMIESVLSQTYSNWELCIADDASTNADTIQTLKEYESKHENIKVVYRKENGHMSEASNSALKLAWGEYIVFLDHDDMLSPNALYEMVKKLNENQNLKLIYSDEDKIDENNHRYQAHFKSGWNPDLFYSQNYLCHLVLLKKSIVDKIGGLRKGYEGSQDYDLLIRYIDEINHNEIDRIEKILYHWRAIQGSTALDANEKSYAHIAGLKALKSFFIKKDKNITVEHGLLKNTYKVNYPLPKEEPLVSIIIPTRDGYNILSKCIKSILEKTLYKNYEIIIIDNQTTSKKTLAYFNKLDKYENIRILKYPHAFNYSAINNFAVKHAKGEIIALLNNDVEIISYHWLTEMVQHAIREDIGAVGAMLYYDDNTIQHAGVILGIGGVAGHSHKYFQKGVNGYFSRLKIIQNLSAVTGACIVVRKKLYEEIGGLEENLKVAFNDVDFCLKLIEKGYRNLWTPYVELYHHESISRGKENNPEKIARFNSEIDYMKSRWLNYLQADNYYNYNLTLIHENFTLKNRENFA